MAIDWDSAVLGPLFQVFAEPVTYTPSGGAPFALPSGGVFDQAYREVTLVDDVPATEETPVLGVRLADFTTPPAQNDQLEIASVDTTYIVQEVRLDGHGYAKLMLSEVSSP